MAIVGGGPAGSFLALHLLQQSSAHDRPIRIVLFEHLCRGRRGQSGAQSGPYDGCPRCAGGVSPRLSDALAELDLHVPDDVLQTRLRSISVQGRWKPVHFDVPHERNMLSVYRGTLPKGHGKSHAAFDAMLIDAATSRGAELIGGRVTRVFYDSRDHPVLCFDVAGTEHRLRADFVAFAGGVNDRSHPSARTNASTDLFRMIQPAYRPPRLRQALIVELSAPPQCTELKDACLYLLESSIQKLRLDMCSILPKQGYFTITLIGPDVDAAESKKDNLIIINKFLASAQTRQILPVDANLEIDCACNPHIVTGAAKMPFGHRAAVVGDMMTTRQYKDGMLAAHDMARALAEVVIKRGIDTKSLAAGYGPTLNRFRRDNRYAVLIFNLYRWFFQSPTWSRIIYQTFVTERKSRHKHRRSFERLFWSISSGDDDYKRIALAMLSPSTAWQILTDGMWITLRNWLTEQFFGLYWTNLGRFPVAQPIERLHEQRSRLVKGMKLEFECAYTIRIRATPEEVRRLLAELGESGRPFLNPRWVGIQRIAGDPLGPGCTIQYRIFGGAIAFRIVQDDSGDPNLIRYRVLGGFADGGFFQFLINPIPSTSYCTLTIHLAFDYKRGQAPVQRLLWLAFRWLFPEYIHEVLWNHALCQFKQAAEGRHNSRTKISIHRGMQPG